MRFDVVVLGDGPAALAAAAACSTAGLTVARVGPTSPRKPWVPAGIWVDELAGLGLEAVVLGTWDDVRVVTDRARQLDRSSALLDGERLAARLLEEAGDASVVAGRAVGANHDRWQSTVVLHDARLVDAVVVVDASGPWPALVHRSDEGDEPRPRALVTTRTTVGVVARCSRPPGPEGACVLMDWSGPTADDGEPSWSSAFDLGDDRWLLRETALTAHPDHARLSARLRERLAVAGVVLGDVEVLPDVVVDLGLPIPSGRQRTVGFGAAAAMVDPLTGWSIGSLLRSASALAEAIVAALDRRATPAGVSAAAWGAVWPAERRRARAVELALLRSLVRLERAGAQAMIDGLLAQPPEQSSAFLSGQATGHEAAASLRAATQAARRAEGARIGAWVRPRPLWPRRARPA